MASARSRAVSGSPALTAARAASTSSGWGRSDVSDRTGEGVDRRRARTHGAEHRDQTSPVSWADVPPPADRAADPGDRGSIWVASEIGCLNTVGLLILLSIIGLWVVKRQGMGIVMALQETAQRREKPANSLMDGS